MIRTASLRGEPTNRRHLVLPNGTGYWRGDLLISDEGQVPAPHAFMIEQDPRTLIAAGTTLPRFATAIVSADEPAVEIIAVAEGLEVLALQFPRRA